MPKRLAMAAVDWTKVPDVSYVLTAEEARGDRTLPSARDIRNLRIVYAFSAIAYLGIGVTELIRHRADGLVWMQLALGIASALFAALYPQLLTPRGRRSYELHFDDAGIRIGSPHANLVRWPSVWSIRDTGDLFVFERSRWRRIIVPKRVFADDGAALWAALDDRLTGTRQLRRRPITNTAATN